MERKIKFLDIIIRFLDNIIDFLGPRTFCNFMAIAKILLQFYSSFTAKTIDFIAISGQFQGEKIDLVKIMWR